MDKIKDIVNKIVNYNTHIKNVVQKIAEHNKKIIDISMAVKQFFDQRKSIG